MKRNIQVPILMALLAPIVLGQCGAPLKRADDVKSIFDHATQLNEKYAQMCSRLNLRQTEPNLNGLKTGSEICTQPGKSAINYNALGPNDSLGFSFVRTQSNSTPIQGSTQSETIFAVQMRTEVWLNRGLVQLASTVFDALQSETNNLLSSSNPTAQGYNNSFDAKIIGQPKFDKENFELTMQLNLVSTRQQNGYIDINNTFQVMGKLFNDTGYFVASVFTPQPASVKDSVLRDIKTLIVVMPHAGDILMDITVEANFYSFGVDAIMKQQVENAFAQTLRSIPDLVTKLENKKATTKN